MNELLSLLDITSDELIYILNRADCIPGELGVHEPLEDIGHYLDKWFSILVIRAKNHNDLLKLAETTEASVINE